MGRGLARAGGAMRPGAGLSEGLRLGLFVQALRASGCLPHFSWAFLGEVACVCGEAHIASGLVELSWNHSAVFS